jgi:hypothetical protein
MTQREQQLIQLIAGEVIAQLKARQRQAAAVPASPAHAAERSDADIHPPIGTCTGDYSKFPELAKRMNPPQSAGDLQPAPAAAPPSSSALTGFVTENQLREAIKSSAQGVALLAAEARLTPLGNDFARQFPEKIQRVTLGRSDAAMNTHSATDLPWHWWIQGQCPIVTQVTSERAARLRTMASRHGSDQLGQVVRDLAAAVKSNAAAGGLLFVPSAARVMCMANRCASLRAVVGTCGEAVEQGVRELGANVLVIEYPHHGPRSIAAMVDRIMTQKPAVPAAVQRDLADLHRCG